MSLAPYRAAVVQGPIDVITDPAKRDETIELNRSRIIRRIESILETSGEQPKLFQFPVLFLQGAYNEKRSVEARYAVSIELPGPEIEPLIELCAKHDIYIGSSCVERHAAFPGWFFHSGLIIGPTGLLVRYPKAQARSSEGVRIIKDVYAEYSAAVGVDAVFPVADTPIGRLSISVEAEIKVPEVARSFASKGAEVLLHPTVEQELSAPGLYDHLKSVRAFENRMYLVSANVGIAYQRHPETGEMNKVTTRGHSLIAGPDGRILNSVSGSGEGLATAEIDIEALRALRATPARDLEYSPVLYQDLYKIK